jgi:hypothetical protein
MIYLYDPRTNILTETNYLYLIDLTNMSYGSLASYKSKGKRLGRIKCYIVDETTTLKQRKAWYAKEKYQNEVWKIIDGSDDKFLISNYGRVKRVYKKFTGFLLPSLYKKARYLVVKVKFHGVYKSYQISKLVAYHFVATPKPGDVLHHKNLIKTDDYSGNLEYISRNKLGKKTGQLAKSKEVVQFDRFTGEVLNEYRSAREAGRECFVSYQSVADCCNGKYKSSGGIYVFKWAVDVDMDDWEYEELEG